MFQFKNLLEIFSINWSDVLNQISPKDNNYKIDSNMRNNIFSGLILIIGASLFEIIVNSNIILSIIKIIIFGVSVYLLEKNKLKDINASKVYVLFIISSLLMLCNALLTVMYLVISTTNMIRLLSAGLALVETLGSAFLVVSFYNFCYEARVIYDKEHMEVKNEEIKLSTIDVNDIGLHGSVSCPNCNASVSVNSLFCDNCGTKLK